MKQYRGTLAEYVMARRGLLHMTVTELAEKSGLSKSEIISIEAGRIKLPGGDEQFGVEAAQHRGQAAARERFARIVKDLGLPPLTPHGLRHTVASYLFQRRVPALLISRLLGHASVAITQDLYTHISDDDRGEVARAIEGALGDERTERVS
jgi:AcrR family transcriptional regulator